MNATKPPLMTQTCRYASWIAVCLLFVVAASSSAGAAAPPNVILCMADDQGWGDVGYYGKSIAKTPVLDEMASVGLRFDRFYSASCVCSSSEP